MNKSEINIECPEGYELDKDESIIKFKKVIGPRPTSLKDLPQVNEYYYIDSPGDIIKIVAEHYKFIKKDTNIIETEEMAKCIHCINAID